MAISQETRSTKEEFLSILYQDPYINSNNVNHYILSGGCDGMSDIIISVSSLSFTITCSNSEWNADLDLSSLNEQEHVFTVVSKETLTLLASFNVTKDTLINAPLLIEDNNYGAEDQTSLFDWSAVNSDQTGISSYEIAIGTTPGGTNNLSWIDVGDVTSYLATGLSNLVNGTLYYTSVRAKDIAGNYSAPTLGNGWRAVTNWKIKSTPIIGNSDFISGIIPTNDGGAIVHGEIHNRGFYSPRGAVLKSNGSIETSVGIGIGFNDRVYDSALQPDGKIVVVGWFSEYQGHPASGVMRLNKDGTKDTTFVGGYTGTSQFETVALLPDGSIIVSGYIGTYDGYSTSQPLLKLNPDGTRNTSFSTSINGSIYALAVQPDGQILIGGSFTTVDGISRVRVARINQNGSLDATFNPGTGIAGGYIYKIVPLVGSQILFAGGFTTYNGSASSGLVRTSSIGARDATFNMGSGFPCCVFDVLVDGTNYYVGGNFSTYKGQTTNKLAKVDSFGAIDPTFNVNVGLGAEYAVYSIKKNTFGKLIVGGEFASFNGIPDYDLIWLNTDGTAASGYSTGKKFNWVIKTILVRSDDSVFVGGYFDLLNWEHSYGIFKVDANMNFDPNFSELYTNGKIYAAKATSAGKYLVGGDFTWYEINGINRVLKLNSNGTRDAGFNSGTGCNNAVRTIAIQTTDDKYFLGGDFTMFNGNSSPRLSRITSTGAFDSTFNIGTGFNLSVKVIEIQNDGKILVGGDFTTYNGSTANRLVRLTPNGSIDLSFVTGSGFNGTVNQVKALSNGKILVAGSFTSYNGVSIEKIVGLNEDGTINANFNAPSFDNTSIYGLTIQSDGKIIATGDFAKVNLQSQPLIVRLNSNGSVDRAFKIGVGPSMDIFYGLTFSYLNAAAILSSGEILIGGGETYHFDNVFSGPLYKIGW